VGMEDRLRDGLSDLAEGAGWTDMQDRVQRASRRMAIRRRIAMSVAAAALVAAAVPVALMSRSPDPSDHLADPASPIETVTPSPGTSSVSPSGHPSTPSSSVPSSTGGGEPTGCPVSAAALLAALSNSRVATDVGHPTGLTEVTCYKRYATAVPAPRAGSVRILFGYTLPERTWIALTAGTAGMCDRYILDGAISSRLPGC
jgi:hypothetical protein